MGELLRAVSRQQTLLDAWHETRRDVTPGSPSVREVEAFADRAATRIAELGAALLAGTWRPSPVRPARIPKPGGATRELGISVIEDRIVERAILRVLDPVIDPRLLPWSFGYRRGLGVNDAIETLIEARDRGAQWVLRGDFRDCFPSVPRGPLLDSLRRWVGDSELVEVIRLLVYRPVRNTPGSPPRGLHQGSALSPLLANVYLHQFDAAMMERNWQVIRYADDFAVPCWSEPEAREAQRDAVQFARALHLDLDDDKCATRSFELGVPFLGRVVSMSTGRRPGASRRPRQSVLYAVTEGGLFRSKGSRLRLEHEGRTVLSAAFNSVRQIVVFGRVGLTTPFITQLLSHGIDLVLLSPRGHYLGRLQEATEVNPQVRLAQFRVFTDSERRLRIAQQVVAGKIANQRVLLLRAARRNDLSWLSTEVRELSDSRQRALEAPNLTTLRGIEGAASRRYFRAFARLLPTGWVFESRRRRPPPDPVNAMLSLGYTLLLHDAISGCESAQLDPYVGMLHDPQLGRPSLALDVIEEFRPVLVDSVVLRAVTTRAVRADDFVTEDDSGRANCRMTTDGLRRFLALYERRMLTVFRHTASGQRANYRIAVHLQADQLRSLFTGGRATYEPVLWK